MTFMNKIDKNVGRNDSGTAQLYEHGYVHVMYMFLRKRSINILGYVKQSIYTLSDRLLRRTFFLFKIIYSDKVCKVSDIDHTIW